MDKTVRMEGENIVVPDEVRAEYVRALRRIADKLEARVDPNGDDGFAFVLGVAHREDNGEAISACFGNGEVAAHLAATTARQTLPAPIRELLEKAEARIERLEVAARDAEKGISLPRGLNPEDADVSKLPN